MKGHERHVVFLPPRAVEILKETKQLGGAYAFPSPQRTNRALSNMAMATVIRRMNESDAKPIWVDPKYGSAATVHGFRASFSSWAYEVAQRLRPELAREDVIEACLAHQETNRVKAAYSRARFDDDRRELLGMWTVFIDSKPASLHDIARAKSKRKAA